MKVVNPYLIEILLEPFLFLDDDEKNELSIIGPDSEGEIRKVFKNLIVPYFSSIDEKNREDIKMSFGFYLENNKEALVGMLGSSHCPLPDLDPPVRVFEILWDELFEKEVRNGYQIENFSVNSDFAAPNSIRRGWLRISH
ncbi:hypothetical protein FOC84_14940 [Achromobacter pestifer]|uniref:Uncharacterized protein n=1 Tax=Achromobacter pestifer TaxID=1353889 RepID=A0A7D4E0N8_9BURK|nr:hypothetical protein [Achromobacter pestifer]QKH36174.1 hypothetical protein FOC84_14940 [Achromobacter pestifer]